MLKPNEDVGPVVLKGGQIQCKYGPSPDKPTTLPINAKDCPLFVVRQAPGECKLLQAIFEKATDMLKIKKGKQLVYRGETAGQVAECLRLEVMRPARHTWTQQERDTM